MTQCYIGLHFLPGVSVQSSTLFRVVEKGSFFYSVRFCRIRYISELAGKMFEIACIGCNLNADMHARIFKLESSIDNTSTGSSYCLYWGCSESIYVSEFSNIVALMKEALFQ